MVGIELVNQLKREGSKEERKKGGSARREGWEPSLKQPAKVGEYPGERSIILTM